jgi:hypothetical protein
MDVSSTVLDFSSVMHLYPLVLRNDRSARCVRKLADELVYERTETTGGVAHDIHHIRRDRRNHRRTSA